MMIKIKDIRECDEINKLSKYGNIEYVIRMNWFEFTPNENTIIINNSISKTDRIVIDDDFDDLSVIETDFYIEISFGNYEDYRNFKIFNDKNKILEWLENE